MWTPFTDKKLLHGAFLSCLILSAEELSAAFDPLGELNPKISRLTDALNRQDVQVEVRVQQAWDEIRGVLDFREFARRMLAGEWESWNEEQREQVVGLTEKFLTRVITSRLRLYRGEEIVLTDAIANASGVRVVGRVGDVQVVLSLHLVNKQWRVYDVSAAGVGFLSFYRSQFSRVLQREGLDGLLQVLKEKGN